MPKELDAEGRPVPFVSPDRMRILAQYARDVLTLGTSASFPALEELHFKSMHSDEFLEYMRDHSDEWQSPDDARIGIRWLYQHVNQRVIACLCRRPVVGNGAPIA